uniref:Hepato-portal schistosomula protein n=1 Tax=Schistosoma japonicum TaxID=6182 RepID=Q8MZU3_SCHJA|nr:hepato-portal schistosomula protein [Schistosoma japonicum]
MLCFCSPPRRLQCSGPWLKQTLCGREKAVFWGHYLIRTFVLPFVSRSGSLVLLLSVCTQIHSLFAYSASEPKVMIPMYVCSRPQS